MPTCGSEMLLNQTLRAEWGFDGCVWSASEWLVNSSLLERAILSKFLYFAGWWCRYVTSDSGAVDAINTHHQYTKTSTESAALALTAGCDVDSGTQTGNRWMMDVAVNCSFAGIFLSL